MSALTKQEASTEDRDCGTLLLVSEDTSGSKTSQESHPSVDELSTSEILSRPTSTSITNEVKEKIEVARSDDLPIVRPESAIDVQATGPRLSARSGSGARRLR
ncbi:hypothetical protein JG688_00017079 [Phytophthora aleatoria]|uniref:Uncharacterized protein n=1 Tax=Phytophthora aleatoria TaxID=2496075 RepID=A0A8J5MCF0_9STRA|nr:hypothetical protein JG688_00017079 [Phytophthora aleatoria]